MAPFPSLSQNENFMFSLEKNGVRKDKSRRKMLNIELHKRNQRKRTTNAFIGFGAFVLPINTWDVLLLRYEKLMAY